tara:strand:+ start:114 stop:329 length:216 start_codon:yes stop_codon:yes gene_type:complete
MYIYKKYIFIKEFTEDSESSVGIRDGLQEPYYIMDTGDIVDLNKIKDKFEVIEFTAIELQNIIKNHLIKQN